MTGEAVWPSDGMAVFLCVSCFYRYPPLLPFVLICVFGWLCLKAPGFVFRGGFDGHFCGALRTIELLQSRSAVHPRDRNLFAGCFGGGSGAYRVFLVWRSEGVDVRRAFSASISESSGLARILWVMLVLFLSLNPASGFAQ